MAADGESAKHRGIPKAIFVEDVDAFMKETDNKQSAEVVLSRLDEQHSKYKFMESNLVAKKSRLKSQIPDIKSTLGVIKHMKTKMGDGMKSQFLLSDQLYVKASIPPTDKVCLWLGANVMLEYSLDEADELLANNLGAATKNLSQLEDDLGFLRDQTTTTEVNMARVFNWDVKRKQASQSSSSSSSS